MQPGDRLAPQTFRVTRADLVQYAGAALDFNPIHWSDRIATKVGLPGVISHGMLTMALVGRAVTGWAGDPAAVVDYSVRFTRPVVVPDDDTGAEIEVSAVVKSVDEDGRVLLNLTATFLGENVLAQARAVIRCPHPQAEDHDPGGQTSAS
ncbi:MAG TPA: MaoC family dehydratase [Micromonosporaceae bacterium]|nr:MaoC family dehydratase [Micromonosporaceae bacterium]